MARCAHFNYAGAEYVIAANQAETTISATDMVVHFVDVQNLHVNSADGVVTLAL